MASLELLSSREARRRESTARPPRTSGALYRRLGDGTYVNADVEDGEADPMQVISRAHVLFGRAGFLSAQKLMSRP